MQEIKIKNNQVTPYDYGYTSNYSTNDFTNDATDFIQACLDSKYDVFIPAGFYYITKPLRVDYAKEIKMVGNYIRELRQYRKDTIYNKDITVIYTDKNIDFWHIYADNVFFINGTMYTNSVKNPKEKNVFTWFYKDNLIQNGGVIGTSITGDEYSLMKHGAGYNGVFFDSSTNNTKGYRPNNGECHFMTFNFSAWYVNTAFLASQIKNTNHRPNSRHKLIEVWSFGCKQTIVLDGIAGGSTIKGINHGRYVLSEQEKYLPSLLLNSGMCNVDFTLLEANQKSPNGKGLYSHKVSIENNSTQNILSGNKWFWNLRHGNIVENVKFINSHIYREWLNLK